MRFFMSAETAFRSLSATSNPAVIPAELLQSLKEFLPAELVVRLDAQSIVFDGSNDAVLMVERCQPPEGASEVVCAACGGDDVVQDANAVWDVIRQESVLGETFGNWFCKDCEDSVDVITREVCHE
jgi:hypothetical protein